jgi:hypothetical protein
MWQEHHAEGFKYDETVVFTKINPAKNVIHYTHSTFVAGTDNALHSEHAYLTPGAAEGTAKFACAHPFPLTETAEGTIDSESQVVVALLMTMAQLRQPVIEFDYTVSLADRHAGFDEYWACRKGYGHTAHMEGQGQGAAQRISYGH